MGGQTKKLEKARMRGGCRGVRGSRGVWGGSRGLQGRSGSEKRLKHEKTRKTLRNCMASLLRSSIQDFVQEVPVGQMAHTPPRVGGCLPGALICQNSYDQLT